MSSPTSLGRRAALALLVLAAIPSVRAQSQQGVTVARVRVARAVSPIDWATADSITGFVQRDPDESAPATEPTVVKVMRDDDALLIRVIAHDRDPSSIRATQRRRDADLTSDDNVELLIDSFRDHRTAFLFATNPNGAMWDAQLTGREDINVDWNGIWAVTTRRDSAGWSADFRIPFRTLRFKSGGSATFGFNVSRLLRRRNEESLWTAWRRVDGITQLNEEGELTDIGAFTRGAAVEVKPYALAQVTEPAFDVAGQRLSSATSDSRVGGDAKVALTSTMTADLTVHTDFAQVEADQQVINLTRFPIFFPEKRDFFLESASVFEFGDPEAASMFYSRRIGLNDGEPVSLDGGVRVTGREGPWQVGILDARTGDAEQANDAVVRVKHDVLDRGSVGAMWTGRSGPGVPGLSQSAGLDGSAFLVVHGENLTPEFWMAGTHNADSTGVASSTPTAWFAGVDFPNDKVNSYTSLSRIGAGYDPQLGFVPRSGIMNSYFFLEYMPRPTWPGVRKLRLRPIPGWSITTDEGASITDVSHWQSATFAVRPFGATFQSGDLLTFDVTRDLDRPTAPFDIADGVTIMPGAYWWTRAKVALSSSTGRTLSTISSLSFGDFYDGRSVATAASLTWRGGSMLVTQSVTNTTARLPSGSFDALVTGTQFEYDLGTRTSAMGFVQYNSFDRRADFNVRLHWIPRIGDDWFLVWNSGYTTADEAAFRFPSWRSARRPLNGALILKATHRFAM